MNKMTRIRTTYKGTSEAKARWKKVIQPVAAKINRLDNIRGE